MPLPTHDFAFEMPGARVIKLIREWVHEGDQVFKNAEIHCHPATARVWLFAESERVERISRFTPPADPVLAHSMARESVNTLAKQFISDVCGFVYWGDYPDRMTDPLVREIAAMDFGDRESWQRIQIGISGPRIRSDQDIGAGQLVFVASAGVAASIEPRNHLLLVPES